MTEAAATTAAEDSSPKPARPEGSQPGVLSEIQLLGEELKTVHEVTTTCCPRFRSTAGFPWPLSGSPG